MNGQAIKSILNIDFAIKYIGRNEIIIYIVPLAENIALNRQTYQLYPFRDDDTFDASNAVDGLKSDLRGFSGQCVVSANNKEMATWWVNLTSVMSIHHITIYYRTDNVPWGNSSILL